LAALRDIILRNTKIQVLPEDIYHRNDTHPWLSSSQLSQPEDDYCAEEGESADERTASIELMPSVYSLEWKSEEVEYPTFTLLCKTTGWIGLRFQRYATDSALVVSHRLLHYTDPSSGMVEADIVIGMVKDGVGYVEDY